MRYLIEHETRLEYAGEVREHHCELRLAPREDSHQRLLVLELETDPAAELREYLDCFGNRVHHFQVLAPHDHLATRMRAEVECTLENPFDFELVPPPREREWLDQALRAQPRLLDYVLHRSAAVPALPVLEPAEPFPDLESGRQLMECAQEAMHWVRGRLDYAPGATHVHSSLAEAWKERAGVCQDFAHLMIALVRSWGVPARYVMGYLDPSLTEETEAAEQATHAWVEVLIPNAGWRGFDPTHDLVANDTYVAVAVGRDYLDAAPQRGTYKGESGGAGPQVRVHLSQAQ
jgi:transglutaminase-like putative cysteine protease